MEVIGSSYQAWNGSHRGKDKWPVSIWKIFSQSNPSGLIEYFQNISSELNFFNPGGHFKIVVSAPNFVLLSALCFHTGNN